MKKPSDLKFVSKASSPKLLMDEIWNKSILVEQISQDASGKHINPCSPSGMPYNTK